MYLSLSYSLGCPPPPGGFRGPSAAVMDRPNFFRPVSTTSASAAMNLLTQRLIAEELARNGTSDGAGRAAFRVCAKLRPALCTFAGAAGYRSLMARALALAQREAPLLDGVQLMADGLFHYSPELEAQLGHPEVAAAAAALTRHLLGLLVTFIGEALTLRLVQDVWPKAALKDSKTAGNSS